MTTKATGSSCQTSSSRRMPYRTSPSTTFGRGSGIWAKFHPPEESFADFHIAHDARAPGLIQAAGIDSPGLTVFAIGAMVAALVDEALG